MLAGESRQHVWHSARESRANVCRAFGIVALAVATISPVAWSRQQAPSGVQKDQPAAKAAAVDSLGDALPEGARLRLGTLRFRPPRASPSWRCRPMKRRSSPRAASSSPGMPIPAKSGGANPREFGSDVQSLPTACAPGVLIRQLSVLHTGEAERGGDLGNLPRHSRGARGQVAEGEMPTRSSKFLERSTSRLMVRSSRWVTQAALSFAISGQFMYEIANAPEGPSDFDRNDRLSFAGHYSLGRFSPTGSYSPSSRATTPI